MTAKTIWIPSSTDAGVLTTTGLQSGQEKGNYCMLERELERPQDLYCTQCSNLMFDPQQVTCCGKNFCLACVDEISAYNNPCGNCKAHSFVYYSNTELKSIAAKLRVHCPNFHKGCKWVGSPQILAAHLNPGSTTLDRQGNYCQFVQQKEAQHKCQYCFQKFSSPTTLSRHARSICELRPHTCQHCNEYTSTFRDVQQNHKKKCDRAPVACTNKCGETVLNIDLENHLKNDCPIKKLQCEFALMGCPEVLHRSEHFQHSQQGVVYHLNLVARKLKEMDILEKKLKEEVSRLKEQNQKLEKKLEELQAHLPGADSMYSTVPTPQPHPMHYRLPESAIAEFTIKNISKLKRENAIWSSPPFYTAQKGHRLYLQVMVNGQGKYRGKGMSISIHKTIGEFDDQLPSQYEGTLALSIVSERQKVPAYRVVITIENDLSSTYANVMPSSYLDNTPLKTIPDFADHSILSHYINKDSLIFTILRLNI